MRHGFDAGDPTINLGLEPPVKLMLGTNEATHVAGTTAVLEVEVSEGSTGCRLLTFSTNHNALGRLGEVATWRPFSHELMHDWGNIRRLVEHAKIISIPRLQDLGGGLLEGLSKGEESNSIQDHGEGITLGDPFMTQ